MGKHKRVVWGIIFLLLLLLLAGCSHRSNDGNGEDKYAAADTAGEPDHQEQIPTYRRETKTAELPDNANPYMMYFSEEECFYFSMEVTPIEEEGEEEPTLFYQFYRQGYGDKKANSYVTVMDGYVKDFVYGTWGGSEVFAVLTMGDMARLQLYDGAGRNIKMIPMGESFNHPEDFYKLALLPDQEFLLSNKNNVYHLDSEGQLIQCFSVDGSVKKTPITKEKDIYVWMESIEGDREVQRMGMLDLSKGKTVAVESFPENPWEVFPFEAGFAVVTPKEVIFMKDGGDPGDCFINLDKQGLPGSQIAGMFGDFSEIRVVLLDPSERNPTVDFVVLRPGTEGDALTEVNAEDSALGNRMTEDGRCIIQVAIPDSCVYQVEFHAKRFNKSSDSYFVEVERVKEGLEDYLGKGSRPDIVMFMDHTEAFSYVNKGVLVDLLPLIQNQETYSLEGMLPKVKEILGFGEADSMYALGGRFRLLLRSSDGTEYDRDGKCTFLQYLAWYDDYLSEHGIWGMGEVDGLFYPVLHEFYDEKTGTAFFTSDEFKEIMEIYKGLLDAHPGTLDRNTVRTECGYMAEYLVQGPRWEYYYGTYPLTEPGGSMEPLCDMVGNEYIYMRVNYPMSILSTSECVEGALDFLLYYNTQKEWLLKGETEGDYGKCGNTYGYFHVFEEYLTEEIYESEKPLVSYQGVYAAFNEEHKTHLRDLLGRVTSDTVTQRMIYDMFEEEMLNYLAGEMDLDSCCKVLQSRVELYLSENN